MSDKKRYYSNGLSKSEVLHPRMEGRYLIASLYKALMSTTLAIVCVFLLSHV